MENMEENSENIWKIQKKIVKLNREKIIVEKYGGNPNWIVKRFGKYRRKLWKDMENTEEK